MLLFRIVGRWRFNILFSLAMMIVTTAVSYQAVSYLCTCPITTGHIPKPNKKVEQNVGYLLPWSLLSAQ